MKTRPRPIRMNPGSLRGAAGLEELRKGLHLRLLVRINIELLILQPVKNIQRKVVPAIGVNDEAVCGILVSICLFHNGAGQISASPQPERSGTVGTTATEGSFPSRQPTIRLVILLLLPWRAASSC